MEGRRVGLLGGSFNPAHEGHLHASLLALRRLRLDGVWWLVSPQNPLKSSRGMAPSTARLDQARLIAHDRRILVTDIETELGTVYTADTLAALKKRFPRTHFVWLMGSDNLLQLPRWRRWQSILRLVPVAVVNRPGSALKARSSEASGKFARYFQAADGRFALRKPPALTILDARRSAQSATLLRRKSGLPA